MERARGKSQTDVRLLGPTTTSMLRICNSSFQLALDGNVLVESFCQSPSLVCCCSLGKLIRLSNAFSLSWRLCSAQLCFIGHGLMENRHGLLAGQLTWIRGC
jgi:hypothetical protein